MSITLTREQLYQRVWETPIDTLRKEFGISNVGLGKICHHGQTPVPPFGYWAKKYELSIAPAKRLGPRGTPQGGIGLLRSAKAWTNGVRSFGTLASSNSSRRTPASVSMSIS